MKSCHIRKFTFLCDDLSAGPACIRRALRRRLWWEMARANTSIWSDWRTLQSPYNLTTCSSTYTNCSNATAHQKWRRKRWKRGRRRWRRGRKNRTQTTNFSITFSLICAAASLPETVGRIDLIVTHILFCHFVLHHHQVSNLFLILLICVYFMLLFFLHCRKCARMFYVDVKFSYFSYFVTKDSFTLF